MTLEDRQRSFNGLVLGLPGPFGIVSEEGLDDLITRDGDRPQPQEHGSIPGNHLADSKIVLLRLVTTGDRATIEANLATLEAATQVQRSTESMYVFKQPSKPERFVWARPYRRVRPRTQETEHGPVFVDLALKVADPHIYSTVLDQVPLPIYSSTGGGFDLPEDLPFDLGPATEQVAIAVNDGNADAYPLLRIQRPTGSAGTFNGITVTNTTTDVVFTWSGSLAAGQTLNVDFFAYVHGSRDVDPIHIDGATRFSGWQHPRIPLSLVPGSNTLRLDVNGNATDSLALVSFRDTNL